MTKAQVRILSISGSHRSGSTLLDLLLGSLPETCSLGEVQSLKDA